MIDFNPCPVCHEDSAFIESEGNWCVYVQCAHCGSHTAFHKFTDAVSREAAERAVTDLWNMGKVIAEARNE